MEKRRAFFEKINDKKKDYVFCLITTYVLGLISHAYGFFNLSPSHDWLNAFYADGVEDSVKVASGRFFVPIYRALVRNDVAQPWLVGLIGLFFISIAAFFVIKLFKVRSRITAVLIIGVMVTNVTVISQIATYLHEFDVNMLALALAVIAAYLWHRHVGVGGLILGAALLVISVSIYQSYVSVCITLIMIASIFALLEGESTKRVILRGLLGIGMIILALAVYFVLGKVIYLFADVSQQTRTNVFDFSGISNVPLFYAKLFVKTYIHFAQSLIDFKVYDIWLIVPLAALAILTVVFFVFYTFAQNKRITAWGKVVVILLGALLPFGMNVTYVLVKGVGVHDLMIYSVWFTYVLLLCGCEWFATGKAPRFEKKKVIRILSLMLVFIFVWQNILLANSVYLKKKTDAESTFSIMTRVIADLEERDDYVAGETKIAFVGITETQAYLEEFGGANHIMGIGNMSSPISQDIYTDTCNLYGSYFEYVLNYPVALCSNELHEDLKDSEEVKEMPVFPEKGYIEMIDGVLVVRMGELWYSKDN